MIITGSRDISGSLGWVVERCVHEESIPMHSVCACVVADVFWCGGLSHQNVMPIKTVSDMLYSVAVVLRSDSRHICLDPWGRLFGPPD